MHVQLKGRRLKRLRSLGYRRGYGASSQRLRVAPADHYLPDDAGAIVREGQSPKIEPLSDDDEGQDPLVRVTLQLRIVH